MNPLAVFVVAGLTSLVMCVAFVALDDLYWSVVARLRRRAERDGDGSGR